MKIRCLKSDLVKGVSIVSKAVPTKTTMPILECILIDATTDIIKLTANDMELGIETVIRGQIDEKGMIALDARIFSDIVRKLPDNEIVIESGVNLQTLITCEKAKFNISGKSGEDFSYLPYIERENPVSISQFNPSVPVYPEGSDPPDHFLNCRQRQQQTDDRRTLRYERGYSESGIP